MLIKLNLMFSRAPEARHMKIFETEGFKASPYHTSQGFILS